MIILKFFLVFLSGLIVGFIFGLFSSKRYWRP